MLFAVDKEHFINTQQVIWVYPDYTNRRLQFFMTDKNSYFKTYQFYEFPTRMEQDLDSLLKHM